MPFGLSSGFDVAELALLTSLGVSDAVETRGASMTFQVVASGLTGPASYRFEGSLDGEGWFNLSATNADETINENGVIGHSINAPVRFVRFRATSFAAVSESWEYIGNLAFPARYETGPFLVVQGAQYDYRINIDWTDSEDGRTSLSDLAIVSRWGGFVFVETQRQIGTGQPLQQVLYGDGSRLVDFVFPYATNDSLVGEGLVLALFRQTGFLLPPLMEVFRRPSYTNRLTCHVGCS